MNYLNWMKKTFPELTETPEETFQSYIQKAESDTEILRLCIMLAGTLIFFIPFSLYQAITEVPFYLNPWYWLLPIAFFKVGGFIYLYCEQKLIKNRLKKIVQLKYT